MADFLTAVKAVRTSESNGTEKDLLTAVTSRNTKSPHPEPAESPRQNTVRTTSDHATRAPIKRADTPKDVLENLRSRPDRETVLTTLRSLSAEIGFSQNFSLHDTGPIQAQIINVLLQTIVPDYWPLLEIQDARLLARCLQNLTGMNALIARLRFLSSSKGNAQPIWDVLKVAEAVFSGDDVIYNVWTGLWNCMSDQRKGGMAWKEVVNLLGSGKVIAATAQAEDSVRSSAETQLKKSSWLSNGSEYAMWLGRCTATLACKQPDTAIERSNSRISDAAQVHAKALHLGHPSPLLDGLTQLSSTEDAGLVAVIQMAASLPTHSKRTFTEHALRWLSSKTASTFSMGDEKAASQDVPAPGALLVQLLKANPKFRDNLQSQTEDPVSSQSLSLIVLRASVASLAAESEEEYIQELLERLSTSFSSTLFIAHAPIAQQERLAQTMLLLAGYVHRKTPMALLLTARSSGHMQGISNRLDSSNSRARWLGMVVGSAFSSLIDKPGSQMDFGTEEVSTVEARWYKDLIKTEDAIGTMDDFSRLLNRAKSTSKAKSSKPSARPAQEQPKINGKAVFGPERPPAPLQTAIVGDRVTEVLDGDSEDDDDLKPYAKPDSDPEDSDEDATLVNRNKARAPVYIRDLMVGLRNDKDYDNFNLAIKNAAPLIRRKAGFGKEVTDHAEELVGIFCNLQDPFSTDDFDELRLQALIALVLSDPSEIAPLLARQAFVDGFSIAQRCVILSALGLGGRELAGFKIEDETYNPKLSNTDFPSKKLPPRLHAIYGSPSDESTKRLESASKSIEHQMIQPMALKAADQSTAELNAVKVRTFSSRMDVEKARTKRKPPANELAKRFGQYLFFPLANRYQQEISAYGSGSVYSSASFVVVTFVKTLAILLHASGPATLGLPEISAEMWDLLLSLRVQAISDISILQAVLFALLTLLEVNTDRQRIAQDHPKQLMETQQWVDLVFERMGSTGLVSEDKNGDEAKVKTLAAGVLMKCREIIEAYQKQLVGHDLG